MIFEKNFRVKVCFGTRWWGGWNKGM